VILVLQAFLALQLHMHVVAIFVKSLQYLVSDFILILLLFVLFLRTLNYHYVVSFLCDLGASDGFNEKLLCL